MIIIIPTLNKNELLNRTLLSIKKNNMLNNIIIVNNYSKALENIHLNDNNSRIINLFNNLGFSKAVNIGIKEAKYSELIFLLNDDTEIINNIDINEIKRIFDNDKNLFSISLKMLQYHSPDKIDDAGDMYTIFGWQYKRGNGLSKELYNKPTWILSSCGGAAIYNKKILDEIGYFDEDFFAYLEDVDLGLRALTRGYKNLYYPDIEVLHVGSATTGGKYNDFTIKMSARNSIYLIYKNIPLSLLIINLPFLIIGYLIKFIFFIFKGKGKIYFSGIIEGFKNLYKFKEKRRENMNKKKISNIKFELLLIKATLEYFKQFSKKIIYKIHRK